MLNDIQYNIILGSFFSQKGIRTDEVYKTKSTTVY